MGSDLVTIEAAEDGGTVVRIGSSERWLSAEALEGRSLHEALSEALQGEPEHVRMVWLAAVAPTRDHDAEDTASRAEAEELVAVGREVSALRALGEATLAMLDRRTAARVKRIAKCKVPARRAARAPRRPARAVHAAQSRAGPADASDGPPRGDEPPSAAPRHGGVK